MTSLACFLGLFLALFFSNSVVVVFGGQFIPFSGNISCDEEIDAKSPTGGHYWFLRLESAQRVTITTCAFADFDTSLELYSSNTGELVAENDDDDDCFLKSTIKSNRNAGDFYIRVYGYFGEFGSYRLNVTCDSLGNGTIPTSAPLNASRKRDLLFLNSGSISGSGESELVIDVRSNISGYVQYMYSEFTVRGNTCNDPRISIDYIDTDFSGGSKYFEVYYYDGYYYEFILDCGSDTGVCDTWRSCLENYSIPLDKLDSSDVLEVMLLTPITVGSSSSNICPWVVEVNITLHCTGDGDGSSGKSDVDMLTIAVVITATLLLLLIIFIFVRSRKRKARPDEAIATVSKRNVLDGAGAAAAEPTPGQVPGPTPGMIYNNINAHNAPPVQYLNQGQHQQPNYHQQQQYQSPMQNLPGHQQQMVLVDPRTGQVVQMTAAAGAGAVTANVPQSSIPVVYPENDGILSTTTTIPDMSTNPNIVQPIPVLQPETVSVSVPVAVQPAPAVESNPNPVLDDNENNNNLPTVAAAADIEDNIVYADVNINLNGQPLVPEMEKETIEAQSSHSEMLPTYTIFAQGNEENEGQELNSPPSSKV